MAAKSHVFGQQIVQDPVRFSDLHNSGLSRLFHNDGLYGLRDTAAAINYHSIGKADLLFFSLGLPQFEMRHADTVSMEQVLVFFRAFRDSHDFDFHFLSVEKHRKSPFKTNIAFAIENAHLLDGEAFWVDSLAAAGVCALGLAHWFHHACFEPPAGARPSPVMPLAAGSRLSAQGRAVMERAWQLGMLLDLSHFPDTAFWQAVELNVHGKPLIASHSNARACCDNARNLTDEQMRAIAATGGMIGFCLHSPLIDGSREASWEALVAHLEHIRSVVGPRHICLGTDWEGRISPPPPISRPEQLENLRQVLLERGWSPSDVKRLFYRNLNHFWKRAF